MRMLLLLSAVILLSATDGRAATNQLARDQKKIEALLVTLRLEESTSLGVARMLRDLYVSNPALDIHQDIMTDYVEERLSWASLKDDVVRIYATHFTDAEIAELQRFYSSPIGRKLLDTGPALEEEIRTMARTRFDADLGLLELRMKNRELDALEEAATFYDPKKHPEQKEKP